MHHTARDPRPNARQRARLALGPALPLALCPLTLCLLTLCVLRGAAHAATFTVDRTDDSGSVSACTAAANDCNLRGAMDAANSAAGDDAIVFNATAFAAPQKTITLGGTQLLITSNLTITGPAAGVTISGNNQSRVFQVDSGTVTLDKLTITGGSTNGAGGGILNSGTLTVQNCTLSQNSAGPFGFGGGGISNSGGSTLTVLNCTLSHNSATSASGGGIYNGGTGGTVTVQNSTLSQNSAGAGGGISNPGGAVTVQNSTLSQNSATYIGGGIHNDSTLTVQNSTLSNNSATGSGGGIYSGDTLTVQNCTLSHNSTTGDEGEGGGLYNKGHWVTVQNSTLSQNSATYVGGGISNVGTLTVRNCTLSQNSAEVVGGIHQNTFSTLTIGNTILHKGSASGVNMPCFGDQTTSEGFNLSDDFTGPDEFSGACGHGLRDANSVPKLNLDTSAPDNGLHDNGGPTKTHALLTGSAALDTGYSSLTTDQRGRVRPFVPIAPGGIGNFSDIGAVEMGEQNGRSFTVNTNADPGSGGCTEVGFGDGCTLREAITLANAQTGADTIGFAIGSGPQTISLTVALPDITAAVIIAGSTQPGTEPLPRILVDGTSAGVLTAGGLTLLTNGCEIYGLGLQNFDGSGVAIGGNNNVLGLKLDGSGAKNRIWNNGSNGVAVYFGTGNIIRGNSWRGNGGPNIDLNSDGDDTNDAGDPDGNANRTQNYPILTSAALGFGGTNTIIGGTLNSAANRSYRLDFYRGSTTGGVSDANSTGTFYLGSLLVTTDGTGNLATPFSFDVGASLSGVSYAATATDTSTGDTSEFSAILQQDGVRPTISISAPNPAGGALMVGQNFPQIGGNANDNLASVTVRLNLIRVSDGFYWDGSAFVPTPTPQTILPTSAGGSTWNSTGPLPLAGSTLTDGKYQIVAYAIDTSGNQSVASKTLSYDLHLPTVSITTPGTVGQASGVTVNALNLAGGISGSSAHLGVGMKKVLLKLTRNSDNFQWNGTTWVASSPVVYLATAPADLAGASPAAWSKTSGLPGVGASTTTQMQVGKVYNLTAVAYDRLAQASPAFLLRVKIVSSLSASKAASSE